MRVVLYRTSPAKGGAKYHHIPTCPALTGRGTLFKPRRFQMRTYGYLLEAGKICSRCHHNDLEVMEDEPEGQS